MTASPPDKKQPFLSDIKTLRARAREHIESGNVTGTYVGDAQKTIDILQAVLATELVCVLRYTMHAVAATGISSEGVKAEFAEHAKDEQGHAMEVGRAHQPARRHAELRSGGAGEPLSLAIWPGRETSST